jgi:amidohydrolase
MTLSPEILAALHGLATQHFPSLVSLRRDLHSHPELAGDESRTAALLAEKLNLLGLTVRTGIGGHGLVADLVTDPNAPTVALRVDMDALPIQETNPVPYCSQVPGLMHACGHDVHSAIGVGVAAVLSALADDLPGNVRFLFQPEEEEITGALRMIRAGALRNPAPKAIFGLHVAPLPVGQIGWTDDLFLAGFEHYLISLSPRAGAHLSIADLNAVAERCCQLIRGFNSWEMPETWPEIQAFWARMQAGSPDLADFTHFAATTEPDHPEAWPGQFGLGIKAANRRLYRSARHEVRAAVKAICDETRTTYRLEPVGSMPELRNDADLVQSSLPALKSAIGEDNLVQLRSAFPFNCEDFAFYTKFIPGAMVWLGAANPDQGKYAILHTPDFDVDERCLETGTVAMAAVLWEGLLNF